MKDHTTEKDHFPSALTVFEKRRSLLLGCMAIPASSVLTLLAGCGGGADTDATPATSEEKPLPAAAPVAPSPLAPPPPPAGLTVPLAPYLPDAAPAAATSAPVAADPVTVTRVPPAQPPKSPLPLAMKVGIYNLEYNSWTQVSNRKQVDASVAGAVTVNQWGYIPTTYENIKDYVKRALDDRFALMYRALMTAFAEDPPTAYDVSFFTAPEFYWNVPWGAFLNTAEVDEVADLYLETVTANVRALIAKFPACTYGNLVFLPGTVAVLKPATNAFHPDGKPAGTAASPIYNAINHVVCVHNLPLHDPQHPRPAYMIWPKRVVSPIDFIDEGMAGRCTGLETVITTPLKPVLSDPGLSNGVHTCEMSLSHGLTVHIQYVTPDMAQSFDATGKLLSTGFNNNIVNGLPFGIDICLDYLNASVQRDTARMAQLDEKNFKLDFVIACGINLSPLSYANSPYIQYSIHNDGMSATTENTVFGLYSDVEHILFDNASTPPTVAFALRPPIGGKPDASGGLIAVDETNHAASTHATHSGTRKTDIPSISDAMNPANVRVWALSVDVTDTLSSPADIAAMKPANCA